MQNQNVYDPLTDVSVNTDFKPEMATNHYGLYVNKESKVHTSFTFIYYQLCCKQLLITSQDVTYFVATDCMIYITPSWPVPFLGFSGKKSFRYFLQNIIFAIKDTPPHPPMLKP